MKKISLKNIALLEGELLSRAQLKNVMGGLTGGTTTSTTFNPFTTMAPDQCGGTGGYNCYCSTPAGPFAQGCVASKAYCDSICGVH